MVYQKKEYKKSAATAVADRKQAEVPLYFDIISVGKVNRSEKHGTTQNVEVPGLDKGLVLLGQVEIPVGTTKLEIVPGKTKTGHSMTPDGSTMFIYKEASVVITGATAVNTNKATFTPSDDLPDFSVPQKTNTESFSTNQGTVQLDTEREDLRAKAEEATLADLRSALGLVKQLGLKDVTAEGLVALSDRVGRTITAMTMDAKRGRR